MTYRQTTFLLMLLPFALIGQFDGNFEFLDHRERLSSKGAHVSYDNDLYYVSHNQSGDMTVVNRLNHNQELEVIFSSYFSSQSRTIQTSDSTYSIYLYQLFDYDIGSPGFYAIHIRPYSYKIDSIQTWDSPLYEDYHYIYDFEQTTDSSFIAISDNGLLDIVAGRIKSVSEDVIDRNFRIRKNPNNLVFTYMDTVLYQLNNNTLTERLTTTSPIIDIKHDLQKAYLLTEGSLQIYSLDFQSLENTFNLPASINSFNQILVRDDLVYYVEENEFGTILNSVNSSGGSVFLYEFIDESIKGLINWNNDQFLVNGEYQINNISYNPYFRSIDLNENHSYETIDLEIESFKLYQGTIDTFDQNVDINGDTIYAQKYNYLIEFVIRNNSNEVIYNYDIYSAPYINVFGPSGAYFDFNSTDQILPGDTIRHSVPYSRIYIPTTGFDVALPGANFKFNSSDTRIIFPEFISDVSEIDFTQSISLYPNPASSFLNLDIDKPLQSISIYNLNGHLNYYQSGLINRIDIQHLSSGTYVLVGLDKEGQRFVGRFVKI